MTTREAPGRTASRPRTPVALTELLAGLVLHAVGVGIGLLRLEKSGLTVGNLLGLAAVRPDELLAAEDLRRAAPASVEIWTVPGARHTAGLATDPQGWSRRVVGFLSAATS